MCPTAVPVLELAHRFKPAVDLSLADSNSTPNSTLHSTTSHSQLHALAQGPIPLVQLPSSTDVVIVGNGPAGIILSLLLTGYEPYYHAEPTRPHPDPILHRMLASSALSGCRPRSLLNQDLVQLTNHIQHQLAEAGRDANPISAMFDSLAHPQLDTQRGEYPSFLEWKHPGRSSNNLGSISVDCDVDSPPPTPISEHPTATATTTSTARPHVVLGRGDVGGIWADLDQDFNQTLSYQEHMELPLYSFAEFLHDHPEHGEHLERPLRSTVSAYYKAYVKQIGINSNFSNYTTVTGIYHLKDLDNHCCCSIDPKLRSKFQSKPFFPKPPYNATGTACRTCASFRYAVIGYVEASPINCSGIGGQQHGGKKKTKFLIRSKTVVLATGTFDQPKKLPAVGTHPCSPPCLPTPTIQQTFHDTRQLEEWMARHNSPRIADLKVFPAFEVSPPLSPSSTSSSMLSPSLSSASTYSSVVSSASVSTLESSPAALPTPLSPASQAALPIVIVGTGLSAADAILLIQEKQPWRRIIHIYRHYSASEPSPLKRCHRDVYPEYASVWVKMKKFAMLKNSIQAYPHPPRSGSGTAVGNSGYNSIFGEKSRDACEQCQALKVGSEHGELSPLCSGCAYKGLPDSSVSSWDPLSGEITLILSHGVVIKERVAAVGVFIGKQVHMGFLKGSLAHEMLSTVGSAGKSLLHAKGIARGKSAGRRKTSGQRMLTRKDSSDLLVDIPTPPCTPPRSPVLRPSRGPLLQKQVLQPVTSHASSSSSACHVEGLQAEESDMAESNAENGNVGGNSSEDDTEEEEIDESQILTLLRPLVSDMYSFRIIPTGIPMSEVEPSPIISASTPTIAETSTSSAGVTFPAYPVKPKRCTRLPCYPVRHPSFTASTPTTPLLPPSSRFDESDDTAQDDEKDGHAGDRLLLLNDSSITASNSRSGGTTEVAKTAASERSGLDIITTPMSCISMPCSPMLCCRIMCPDLSSPPLFTLYSTAASAVSSAMTALLPAPLASSSSSPSPSSPPSSPSSMAMSTSSSTLSSVSTNATNDSDACCCEEQIEEREKEEYVQPLMDQSIYAAGAITGSKFVRYVLGNGVAIVADILRNERVI